MTGGSKRQAVGEPHSSASAGGVPLGIGVPRLGTPVLWWVLERLRALTVPSWALPAAIGFVALTLRLVVLDRFGFNSDEAVYTGQAATLIGDEELGRFFSLFRAHPLMLQLILGTMFRFTGVTDIGARVFVAFVFGAGAVLLTHRLGSQLYGRWIGLAAAAMVAILPYHVLVSRQVLVDTPMAFFVLLAMWLLALWGRTEKEGWLIGAAAAAGAATLTKEAAALIVLAVGAWLLLSGLWRRLELRTVLLAGGIYALIVAPFPLTRFVAEPENAVATVLWQLSRAPNHDAWYFARILLQYGGYPFVGLLLVGAVLVARRRNTGDLLLLSWVIAFFGFFQLWPTKLFSYLMVLVPALAVLAAIGAQALWERLQAARHLSTRLMRGYAATGLVLVLALPLVGFSMELAVNGPDEAGVWGDFDVEVQSFAGGRELGEWAIASTPEEARFLTIGPSLGNILRFYGLRDSVALSVSTDPRKRNPAYIPIANPDLAFREMRIHYIAWDAYSADRSAFYNGWLMRYVRRYGGTPVFAAYFNESGDLEFSDGPVPEGAELRILVYDVPGGTPPPAPDPGI